MDTGRASDTEIKLRRLRSVTDATLSSLDLDEMLGQLLERAREVLEADTATILLLDPVTNDLVATASSGLEEEVQLGVRVPFGSGFAGRIAQLGEPMLLGHIDRSTVVNPILIDKQLRSLAGVPMNAAGRLIGVLHVGTYQARTFTEDDVELLQLVADRASMATQASRSHLERTTTLALQRSLLPARPPAIAGLDVAARYLPGTAVGVGGDWYDVFALPSGRVGVVIGDVAGNGLRAAVVMGRIRSALRAYALESDDPAEVLRRLDRKIQLFEPDAMATAAYAVIHSGHDSVAISLAGHLPPILIDSSQIRAVDAPVDLPLGARSDAPRRTTSYALNPGWGLFLYTDGLVERRERLVSDAIADLLTTLTADDAEQMCTDSARTLLADQTVRDDVALLAVRHKGG